MSLPQPVSGKGQVEIKRSYMASDTTSVQLSDQWEEWTKSGHCIQTDLGSNPDSVTQLHYEATELS